MAMVLIPIRLVPTLTQEAWDTRCRLLAEWEKVQRTATRPEEWERRNRLERAYRTACRRYRRRLDVR